MLTINDLIITITALILQMMFLLQIIYNNI